MSEVEQPLGPRPQPADADAIRQRVFARLFSDPGHPEPARKSGRFELLEQIGRGGMGSVFRAYDPQLDRVVAIKVLHDSLGSPSSAGPRLLREAQAMARLNHQNVAIVHEVSTVGEQVFIVMEFVEGQTLTSWLRAPRTRREILACFLQAAAGLCAAHGAGIVHRDFKPDNVMVGNDGRVRVMDFGLARAADQAREIDATRSVTPSSDPLHTPLTQSGALLGTPAYMAPEQHLGAPADALSDQFSFCVALHEALFGRRPFTGQTYHELAGRVIRGQREPIREGPRWLASALERGLSVDPKQRFPAMDALLRALQDPPRRRRWVALGLLAVLPVAASAAWTGFAAPRCDEAGAALEDIWGAERKRRVEAALLASARPYAEAVWQSTRELLDRYAHRWTAASGELCAARHLGVEGSEPLAQRERCLTARKEELEAFVTLLLEGEDEVLLEAVQAAATLSDVQACDRPGSADALPMSGELRRHLLEAKVEAGLGRYTKAMTSVQQVRALAEASHEPIALVEALVLGAHVHERLGRVREAEDSLREAVSVAGEHEAYELRAIALTQLVYIVGVLGRFHEARELAADAQAVLDVLGAPPLLHAQLQSNLGVAARHAGRLEDALQHYQEAFAVFEAHYGAAHPATARAETNIGTVESQLGRYADANAHLRRALATFERVFGAQHPLVATALGALANNLARQGQLAEASRLHARVLEIRRADASTEHPATARTLYNIAKIAFERGLPEDAARAIAEGRAILAHGEPLTARTAAQWDLLEAQVELQRGHIDAAQARLVAALEADPRMRDAFDVMLLRWTIEAHADPESTMAVARRELEGRTLSEVERGDFQAWLGIEDSVVALRRAAALARP